MTSDEKPIETASDEKTTKQRIIDLSLKYNILSPHTAFIGIEKRINGSNADMVLREVPIEISNDDHHLVTSHQQSSFYGIRRGIRGSANNRCAKKAAVKRVRVVEPDSDHDSCDSLCENDTEQLLNELSICPKMSFNDDLATWIDQLDVISNETLSASILPTLSDECDEESESKSAGIPRKDEILPSNDQDIVRYLINKQKFDGLWELDEKIVEELTRKPFIEFRSRHTDIDGQVLYSVIVILVLETRFSALSSLWYGIVQKARNRIIDLLGKDSNKIDKLFNDVQNQL